MVNTQLALYKLPRATSCSQPLRSFLQFRDSWRQPLWQPQPRLAGPHHGHLLAGPMGLSFLLDCTISAHFPVASANHCPNEGKDCWVSLGIGNSRGGKGEIIGAKVGASLGFPFHFLSPKSEATASWSSWEPKGGFCRALSTQSPCANCLGTLEPAGLRTER